MNCFTSGIIGIGMLGATFATLSVTQEQHDKLTKLFSPELDAIHEKIVNERRNLYIQGLLLGILIAFFCLQFFKTTNRFHRVSFVLAIGIPISVIYYSLMPKSDYMLNHLKTPEENKAWLEVYNTMKTRYFSGMLLGLLSAIPIAYALC